DELVHAVRVIAAGDALLAPRVTRMMIEHFADRRPRTPQARARLQELTERELEVLTPIGGGRSNAEIGAALFIAAQTVKTHVGKGSPKRGCATACRPSSSRTTQVSSNPPECAAALSPLGMSEFGPVA